MITVRMIRWFVIWLLAFSVLLLVLAFIFVPAGTREVHLVLAVVLTQITIPLGWLAAHVARLEEELAKYVENPADPEAAKKLAEFLRKSASLPPR